MESRPTTLQLLPQSKLVEDTTKFIQNKLNLDKPGQDWTCPQNFIKSFAPMKYYKSHPQFFPTQTIPALNSDASQMDISNKRKYSIPIKNMEIWEKRALMLAVNRHSDGPNFPSFSYF